MNNLIPDKEKKLIENEYKKRLAIVCLSLAIFLVLAIIAMLVPSYASSVVKIKEASINDFSGASENTARSEYEKQAQNIGILSEVLAPGANVSNPTDLFSAVVKDKPDGVIVTSFSYSSSTDPKTLTVGGVASDRNTLLSFVNSLKTSPTAGNVDIPVSNFAKDSNINFSITISLK